MTASGRSSRYLPMMARASASVVGIRHRRSGADHRGIVTRNVGNGERYDRGRVSEAGEAATFDAGQVFSHAIDLADIRPAAQQRPGGGLLVGEADAGRRRDPVRRGAPGEQHQHQIVRAGRVGKSERALGAFEPGLVRNRMAGFHQGDVAGRPAVAVAGDGNAAEPLFRDAREVVLFGNFGERSRAFARGEHNQPSVRRRVRQMRRQATRRVRGADRGTEQGFQQFARLRRQFRTFTGTGYGSRLGTYRSLGNYGKCPAASLSFHC